MTGKVISRHMIICDGCKATFGENGEYPTAVDSRTAAAEAGWSVVPKIRANGQPVVLRTTKGKTHNACDVCPKCIPTFEPPQIPARQSGHKAWFTEEIERLRAENQRLRNR